MMSRSLILVVDDDEDVRQSVAEALEDEGYRVATAWTGREALRLLREEKLGPDLILLDMMMPEMDGRAFREEQLKDPALASIPVVVFSAFGVPREAAEQLQAAGYLKKPARLNELLSTIERIDRPEATP